MLFSPRFHFGILTAKAESPLVVKYLWASKLTDDCDLADRRD